MVSIDFLPVSTATFRIFFVMVILSHNRRQAVHFNVTPNPATKWTAQQVIEAFPWDTAPKYLLRDRDGIYGTIFRQRLGNMDIKEVITAPQSPWQNPFDINAADLIFASDSPNISTHRISNLTLSRLLLG
jgi:hypothetical protein